MLSRFLAYLRGLATRRRNLVEADEELRFHLEQEEAANLARGMSPGDARREARLAFGNPRVRLEEVEALKRIPMIETLAQDLRSAIRGLRGAPAFTAVVVAVLTLAMGATTAVFSVVDAVVLRGLPFENGDKLVAFGSRGNSGEALTRPFAAPDFFALRDRPEVFEGVAGVASGALNLRRDGVRAPETLRRERVSAEFFAVLRATPAMGRAFTVENEVAGQDRIAVISHALWQSRFNGAPDVLGRHLPGEAGDIEVVGVMSRDFAYPVGALQPTEVWMPLVIPNEERQERFSAYLQLIARLKDDVTLDRAQAAVDAIVAASPFGQIVLFRLQEFIVAFERPWMLFLLAAVACVLLIACVNVANLFLVRATVRVRELSVRSALGATRWDLTRMLLAESLLLSTLSTAFGVLVAWLGVDSLRALLPPGTARAADIAIDWRVLAVSALAAFITGVAFGLAPVFQWSRAMNTVLREGGRSDTVSLRRQWLRSTFLVAEVALAAVLLVGAALFLTSFARVLQVDLGMDYRGVTLVSVTPKEPVTSPMGHTPALERILEQVGRIPGVDAAAMITANVPFTGVFSSVIFETPKPQHPADQGIGFTQVSPTYFSTLNVRLRSGRLFTDRDGKEGLVAVLNETAAKAYFQGDPVGQVVTLQGRRTIVGVIKDVRGFGPEQIVQREAFVPLAEGGSASGTLVIKTRDTSAAIISQVNNVIWSEFPNTAIPRPRNLEDRFGDYIARRRFIMLLLSLFGVLGVTIAAVGIYGVMTYIVTERTREIGIRMALGALSSTILMSVLRRASMQVALGLVVGLAMAWLLATSVETFLFQVEPHDFRLYAAACAVLVATGLAAAFFPARRAARVDPLIALRTE